MVCILTLTCLLSLITGCKDWFNNDEDVNVEENKLYFSEESYIVDRLALLTLDLNYTGEEEIVWTSSNEEVVMVVDGTILGLKSGDCEITATVGEEQAKCKVSVSSAFAEVEFSLSHNKVDIVKGQELQIKANVKVNGQKVTEKSFVNYKYTSLNTEVVEVSQTGLITAVDGGVANIEVVAEFGGQRIFENIAVSVKEDVTVTFDKAEVVLFDQNINEFTNSEEQLVVYVYEGEDLVIEPVLTWKSENEEIVTVDTNGIVYGVARGQAKVLVEYVSTLGEKVVAETIVNVKDAVAEYTLPSPTLKGMVISNTGLVTWEGVENAASYVVNVNGEDFAVTGTEYQTQTEKSNVSVKIKSVGQGIWYDSEYSEATHGLIYSNLKTPILADFSGKGYESIVTGATSALAVEQYENEYDVMKITVDVTVGGWKYFMLKLPKVAEQEKITVRLLLPELTGGLDVNGSDGIYYSLSANTWGSVVVKANLDTLKIGLYTKTPKTLSLYLSLVADGEKTNGEMAAYKTQNIVAEPEGIVLADFSDPKYNRLVNGATAEVVNYEGEGSVLKVTLEVNGWTYFNLNLPKTPTEEIMTIRFMVPTRTGGLEINGGDAYYSFTEGEWASYSRKVGTYGSSPKVGAYSKTGATFEIYFSLVVDGEKTNEQMRNIKLFGNIPEGYLADYSSEAYASLITAGSWGTTIETEYMPTHAEETNVMKISATTKAGANSNAGIRLFLPKASTTNKVTVKYMIDESYGIAGELHAVVKGEYTNKISTLSKAKGVWITEEIDLTNQTEKDVVELYFWQGGTGVTAVIYVSFVYDGILN